MHSELTIYLYGHYDAMFYILNGIALIVNSSFTESLISLMVSFGLLYHGVNLAYSSAEGRHRVHIQRIIVMVLIVSTIIMQKGDIWVKDKVSGKMDRISNLPLAFTIPVGILEAFGAGITSGFEQAFTPVGSLSFHDYGMIFGSRLVAQSRNWKISNSEFANNMDNFIKRCVVTEAMIGNRLTPQDIIDSNDLLALIIERAGTFRQVEFTQGRRKNRYNCAEAANQLQTYLTNELEILGKRYLNSDFALAGLGVAGLGGVGRAASVLNSQLKSNIELAYGSVLGAHMSAEQIIQQNMMINAIHDYTNKADLYGYTRASMQQESNWMLSSMLAAEYLPIVLTVLKGLIYGSFIFVLPLMIIGGGMQRYSTYLQLVFSMQLWAPLSAILNLFIELYSSNTGHGITGGVLTYASFNSAHMAVDKIVAVASGLQWSIPLLSYSIVKGSVTGFVHLASNLGGTSQSAASMAAGELTTGSRNLDNISIGNMQRAQQIAHKTDLNSSYASGASSYQHADGTIEKVTSAGGTILSSGAGQTMSAGSVRYNLDQSTMNQINETYDRHNNLAESTQLSYNDAKTSTINDTANLVSNLAQREMAGESHNYESMGEQGKALQQAVNHAKELHDQNNYVWEQASGVSVKAYADAGAGTLKGAPIKAEVGVVVDATATANNTNNQSLSNDERVNRSDDTNENFNNLVRAASNENWMRENNIDTSHAHETRGSFEKMQSFGRQLSMHKEMTQVYSEALNNTVSMGGSSSQDGYHLVEKQLMDDYKINQIDAHKMIENHDPRAEKAWNNVVNARVESLVPIINKFKNNITGENADKALDIFEFNQANKVNDGYVEHVEKVAAEKGLDKEKMEAFISNKDSSLQEKGEQIKAENDRRRNDIEKISAAKEKEFKERADKYDENRISKHVGIGGPGIAKKMLKNYQNSQKNDAYTKKD